MIVSDARTFQSTLKMQISDNRRQIQFKEEHHRLPKLDIWAALYMLTFALLRDSSDLHIYKDLYGENNDCFRNLWKVAI